MRDTPPNEYRWRSLGHPFDSIPEDGMNGAFEIPLKGFGHRIIANCIVSDGMDWEHVSVHIVEYGKQRIPTWAEMCAIKDIFWKPEECVVQFHPPQSKYVNNHPHVLHLWKWVNGEIPAPPEILVGIKELGELQSK